MLMSHSVISLMRKAIAKIDQKQWDLTNKSSDISIMIHVVNVSCQLWHIYILRRQEITQKINQI